MTKTINEIFQAYNKEVKKREQVQEELRKCKRQLANLERVILSQRNLRNGL
jgi:hypothetical protein